VLDMFLDLVTLLVDLRDSSPRKRRRDLRKADAAGRPLVFDGAVHGETDYCHDGSGVLEVAGRELVWRDEAGDEEFFGVPVERLMAREVATKRRRAHVTCVDGGQTVTLICPQYAVGYLARVVPGLDAVLGASQADARRV
jgi:hypothetical protein